MIAGYLLEIAFNLSGRLVVRETNHDSWSFTFLRCLNDLWLLRRVIIAGYLLEIAFTVS